MTTTPTCRCGYDFATNDRDEAAETARGDLRRSTIVARTGIVLLATLPIVLVLAVLAPFHLLGPVIVTHLFAGVGATWRGLTARHNARHRLERATKPAELPAARVIR